MKKHFNLKNTLLISFLLISCLSCKKSIENDTLKSISTHNDDVTISLAKQVALTFINKKETGYTSKKLMSKKSDINITNKEILNTKTIRSSDGDDLFYIFNFKPSGFAIISATKKHEPILAYSEKGSFDYEKAELGVEDWLKGISFKIANLVNENLAVDSSALVQWDQFTTRDAPPIGEEVIIYDIRYKSVAPLLNTKWDQGTGYNNLIPNIYGCSSNGGKPPIGCVATAVAQVMKYWNYPAGFAWGSMSNYGGGSETSRLMYDIAEAVDMDYTCSGSGAQTEDARDVLVNRYGYSNTASFGSYNDEAVAYDLDNNMPVILAANVPNESTGHAWVCDGYNRTNYISIHNPGTRYEYETVDFYNLYFSMNWGWGGDYDGYFSSTTFNPRGPTYSANIRMMTRIKPN